LSILAGWLGRFPIDIRAADPYDKDVQKTAAIRIRVYSLFDFSIIDFLLDFWVCL